MPSFDIGSAATTLTNTAKKVVQDTGIATALSTASSAINSVKSAVTSGLSINISNITSAIPGAAEIQSAIEQARSNVNKLGNLFENAVKAISTVASGLSGPVPNILNNYSSFNYIFSLSVLDDTQINFPDETYRLGMIGPLILKSGSGSPNNRIPTAYKTLSNPSGIYEFFIENLQISSSIGFNPGTGNTNATGFKIKIVEPYSMGMFFEVLQAAALTAGHTNYTDMPLLLSLEFRGHIDAGLQNVQIDATTKHFPLKLMNLSMKVTGKGSEYEIEAYPFNEKAYSTVYSQLKTDASPIGSSVVEMLQSGESSLQAILNNRLQEAVKRKDVNVADQILISFPKDLKTGLAITKDDDGNDMPAVVDPSSTGGGFGLFSKLRVKTSTLNKTQVQEEGTINDIGSSTMGFSLYNNGGTPFAKDNFAYDETTGTYTRGDITIDPKLGQFKFSQGTDIVNAINQVILMSEYGRTALNQISSDGSVKWWRVETQLFYIPTDENIAKSGVKPKLVVYRVVPYDVDASIFQPPNAARPGTEEAKSQVIKEYNYIYTGKNTDIIDWNIEFMAGFYTAMRSDGGQNSGDKDLAEQQSGAANGEPNPGGTPTGQAPKPGQIPTVVLKDGVLTSTAYKGGGGLDDNASIAARQFHDALVSGNDMVALDLTILGDPYYLGDSGMGNYTATATDNKHINADGAMNYQSSEVRVNVNFRSPADINHITGMYDFTSTSVSQFSGLYRVQTVNSSFQRGKFTQILKMFRLKGQEVQSTGKPVLATSASESIIPSDTQTFDDGSSIQTFDDGSTLVTDSEGNVTSTPAP
jgi:hypothetical protein